MSLYGNKVGPQMLPDPFPQDDNIQGTAPMISDPSYLVDVSN